MKLLKTFTAALALIAGAGLAQAADLTGTSGSTKDGTGYSSIQGFYTELALGYGFSQGDVVGFAPVGANLSATGTLLNLRAGYDKINLAGKFGAGVYAEVGDAFDLRGGINGNAFSENWSYGAGVKLFYDYGTGQAYVLGGYEGTEITATGASPHLDGGMWGVGVNMKLARNVYAKLEFDQVYYGTVNWTAIQSGSPVNFSLGNVDNRVMFGFGLTVN